MDLLHNLNKNNLLYDQLSHTEKINVAVQIRNFLYGFNPVKQEDKDILIKLIDLIDDNLYEQLEGYLYFSPFPTKNRKCIKYVNKVFTNTIYQRVDDIFTMIFVNFEDLQYHNFENILNFDHYIDKDIEFAMNEIGHCADGIYQFKLKDTEQLLQLDQKNMYAVPLNNQMRGGKRVIFQSFNLQKSLTSFFKKFINEIDTSDHDFISTNSVFRLNHFTPSDKKFSAHYDTPYSDINRSTFSKYTVLIYLTGGKNDSVLKIGNHEIKEIQPNTMIMFDQKYEHEGYPYADNDKVFIRTELLYYMPDYQFNSQIARLFNIACYATKESVLHEEMQQYSNDVFNHIAKMRYKITQDNINTKYFLKNIFDVYFITNGNDYWFHKKVPLSVISIIILIDYFNAKIKETNHKVQSIMLDQEKMDNVSDKQICQSLESVQENEFDGLDKFQEVNKRFSGNICKDCDSELDVTETYCCKYCCNPNTAQYDIEELREKIQEKYISDVLEDECTLFIFDNEMYINKDNINILPNVIKFNKYIKKSINFAACYGECYNSDEYIKEKDLKEHIELFTFPDIQYTMNETGYKLSIDMFNNGFIYNETQQTTVPYTILPADQKGKNLVSFNVDRSMYDYYKVFEGSNNNMITKNIKLLEAPIAILKHGSELMKKLLNVNEFNVVFKDQFEMIKYDSNTNTLEVQTDIYNNMLSMTINNDIDMIKLLSFCDKYQYNDLFMYCIQYCANRYPDMVHKLIFFRTLFDQTYSVSENSSNDKDNENDESNDSGSDSESDSDSY
jgi:hypothetical protein